MCRWRCSQPNLNRVEVIESLSPGREFAGRIAAMTLVSDDNVECMNWNVQLVSVVLDRLVTKIENGIATEQVDRHPLNGRDVNESITLFRIG